MAEGSRSIWKDLYNAGTCSLFEELYTEEWRKKHAAWVLCNTMMHVGWTYKQCQQHVEDNWDKYKNR